ncbi:amidohydrolase family protein [Sphingobium sp. LMA1-1-1.1]|uniref:amidohydrolase family protein n=1 Tax=unclassified Sphingobium TaxID=2611147 RepID=UPI00341C0123
MIVDIHCHYAHPFADQRVRLDEAGIDRSVLVAAVDHLEDAHDLDSYRRLRCDGLQHVGWSGDAGPVNAACVELAAAVQKHRGRFLGFALPPQGRPMAENQAWLVDVLDQGYQGLGEVILPAGGADGVANLLRAAHDHGGLPILFSSYPPATGDDISRLGGLAGEYPANTIIIGHLGGYDTARACELALAHPNIFIDTSTNFNRLALLLCIVECPEKLIFGTNYPYCDPHTSRIHVERTVADKGLLRQIMGLTACRILDI